MMLDRRARRAYRDFHLIRAGAAKDYRSCRDVPGWWADDYLAIHGVFSEVEAELHEEARLKAEADAKH